MVAFSTTMVATVQLIMTVNMANSKAMVAVEKDILFVCLFVCLFGLEWWVCVCLEGDLGQDILNFCKIR